MGRYDLWPLSCISSPPPSPRASVEVFCSQMLPHAITLAIAAMLFSKTAKLFLRLPLRRGCYPAAIFQQSRAEVGPNSYARGDHIRPCYARQKSLKRELRATGKQTAPLEGSSPHTEDTVWFIEKTSAKDTSSPHTEDTVPQKGSLSSPHRVFPAHGGCRPDKSYTHTAVLPPRRNASATVGRR